MAGNPICSDLDHHFIYLRGFGNILVEANWAARSNFYDAKISEYAHLHT